MMNGRSRPGYIFLVSVLVIGAIALATAGTLLLLAWAAEQNGLLVQQSAQAYENARTCTERALREMRRDLHFTGDTTYLLERGNCTIEPIGGSGNEQRTLCVAGRSGDSTHRMEVFIDRLYPAVVIRRWEEVASFSLCP